jgi:hypothetical protein
MDLANMPGLGMRAVDAAGGGIAWTGLMLANNDEQHRPCGNDRRQHGKYHGISDRRSEHVPF